MIAFPVPLSIDVSNYGLYPGTEASPGLHVEFSPGLTLVLGANGLGKSTLVIMLFRLFAGNYDLRSDRSQLGSSTRPSVPLSSGERRVFASRVSDDAVAASARLRFSVNNRVVDLTRSLGNLKLLHLSVDEVEPAQCSEEEFQRLICGLSGVVQFSDWLLLLRHVVFYFEQRRNLLWDSTAQRQLLRILCTDPAASERWSEIERAALTLDSRMRNLRSVLNREISVLEASTDRVQNVGEIVPQLELLEKLQAEDQQRLEELEESSSEIAKAREKARLRLLVAQQSRESVYRTVERERMSAIETQFPNRSETARFILAQLMSESQCLVCGHIAQQSAELFRNRIRARRCVVCDTDLSRDRGLTRDSSHFEKRVQSGQRLLQKAESELTAANSENKIAGDEYDAQFRRTREIREALAERAKKIELLVGQLPPDDAALARQRRATIDLRTRVEEMGVELRQKRAQVQEIVGSQSARIVSLSRKIKRTFSKYSKGFLLESCRLVYKPQMDQLGEGGIEIEYPGFELEMGGADFEHRTLRSGPDEVSESQREFIDLAFRMTLIDVVTVGRTGSIILDAPESSLDAVFTTRAADVLTKFAGSNNRNRLVIASNLIAGDLLPELLRRGVTAATQSKKVVNLLDISTPTTAVRELRTHYDAVFRKIMRDGRGR